jgi:hypothetical protein
MSGKPIVAFRKNVIKKIVPYNTKKESYLKPGAKIHSNLLEHQLFENMFEVKLKEDYEDCFHEIRALDR